MKRGEGMGTGTEDVVVNVGERARDMGGEGKGDIEGKGLDGPLRGEASMVRSTKGVYGMRGMPFLINMRKKVRGGFRREGKVKGFPGLRVRDGMGVIRKVIGGPGRFGS
jgi:hypothetical protein